ncbi:IclR family transcriptional regulator [Novosphingobium lentum]|uniref:IclR family transcriptional regulator n=1 Tax=Novosphingobium lentum TaxID=145287 RepID=UPI00082D59C4|nr:helix-turn-helix domain-containing protein [Novosphingobium lentum]
MSGPVRSLSQGFAILRLLADRRADRADGLTLSDIGRAQGLSPSSCLNLLRTLEAEGAIARDPAGKRYRLAEDWAALGVLAQGVDRMVMRTRPALRAFAAQHEAATGLWRAVPGERLALVALGESDAATRIHMVEGQRQPLGGGATGRALAAADALPPDELARRFAAVRWQQPLALADYLAQVARADRDGFAIDDGLGHAGVCSVGIALPDRPGGRFCLSASFFAGSRSGDEIAALGRALLALARSPELAG